MCLYVCVRLCTIAFYFVFILNCCYFIVVAIVIRAIKNYVFLYIFLLQCDYLIVGVQQVNALKLGHPLISRNGSLHLM